MKRCQAYLWNRLNQHALDYLRQQRGLADTTIEQAHLGYDPGRDIIVIPWYIDEALWRVSARALTPSGRKAPVFAGYKPGLYRADKIEPEKPVVLCEGEFDALIINQEAADLVTAVATGAVTAARQLRWVGKLALCSLVLVAFDTDPAGEKGAQWWLEALAHNARRWRPVGAKDPNEMYVKAGMNLRHWLGEIPEPEPTDEAEDSSVWRWFKSKQ